MAKSVSEQDMHQALARVRHPEIARTLVDMGMLKDIIVGSNKVALTLALPLMGIPSQIRDYLVHSIREALAKLDASLEVEIKIAEMSQEERTNFLKMAQEGWIG